MGTDEVPRKSHDLELIDRPPGIRYY